MCRNMRNPIILKRRLQADEQNCVSRNGSIGAAGARHSRRFIERFVKTLNYRRTYLLVTGVSGMNAALRRQSNTNSLSMKPETVSDLQ